MIADAAEAEMHVSKTNGTKECQCVNRCTRMYIFKTVAIHFFYEREKMKGREKCARMGEEVRME